MLMGSQSASFSNLVVEPFGWKGATMKLWNDTQQRGSYIFGCVPLRRKEITMKRRNPLLAGLFNVLIPGSSHLYVTNNWPRFILFFVVNSFVILTAVLVGNNIQMIQQYTLPQGVCTGSLLLIVLGYMFYTGMQMANARNNQTDSAAHYQSLRPKNAPKDDPISRLAQLQRQRDEGLISSEQQEAKKAEIESKNK
jgi:hypothetical protein